MNPDMSLLTNNFPHLVNNIIDYADDSLIPTFPLLKIKNIELLKDIENGIMKTGNMFYVIDERFKTNKMCMLAVSKNGMLLEHIENQTFEMCEVAVRQTKDAIKCVKDKEMCMELLSSDLSLFKYIKNPTSEIRKMAAYHNIDFVDEYKGDLYSYLCIIKYEEFPHIINKIIGYIVDSMSVCEIKMWMIELRKYNFEVYVELIKERIEFGQITKLHTQQNHRLCMIKENTNYASHATQCVIDGYFELLKYFIERHYK